MFLGAMTGSSENVSMSGMEEASRESTPGLNETARLATRQEMGDTIQSVKESYGDAEQILPSDPSPLQGDEGDEELAMVCVENDLPPSRAKLETTRRPLAFEDAMKLPYNQDCLKPLFGPGMSQRAWDSGKFNIELHCTDPWMKKNWRRCRNICKGGREGGVKFNQLRRNFMRMLWFERKGIHIDWETVDVSSRLVSEQRGTREPINAGTSDGVVDLRKHLREERRRRRRGTSPASKTQLTGGKRGGTDGQQQQVPTAATLPVDENEETKTNLLGGIRVLHEAGLTIVKQDDLNRVRSEACHEREEILRLKTELEREKCARIAAESNRQDDFTRMHIEGCREREEIAQLRTELEIERSQRIAAEASRTEVLQVQISELQQRRDRIASALSCSLCQEDLTVLPTVSLGFCKCQYHVHCFWKHFAANGICMCRKPFPDLLYQYFGRLPPVGTRTGMTEVGQRMEKDAAAVLEDSRANAEIQRAKNVVRELLQEWHVAGGRNGWHLLNLSDTMRMRFDAFHADLQKRAQTLGGNMAREAFLSYANKFGLSTGNFTMLHPGLDMPEELVDTHCAGGGNFSDESGTQTNGGIHTYASEDGEEHDEYRRKMEMIIRATSDLEARSEIEDSGGGFSKRRRK